MYFDFIFKSSRVIHWLDVILLGIGLKNESQALIVESNMHVDYFQLSSCHWDSFPPIISCLDCLNKQSNVLIGCSY